MQYGDFWYENILVDEASEIIVGIIDFENATIGDPVQDFATQLSCIPLLLTKKIPHSIELSSKVVKKSL